MGGIFEATVGNITLPRGRCPPDPSSLLVERCPADPPLGSVPPPRLPCALSGVRSPNLRPRGRPPGQVRRPLGQAVLGGCAPRPGRAFVEPSEVACRFTCEISCQMYMSGELLGAELRQFSFRLPVSLARSLAPPQSRSLARPQSRSPLARSPLARSPLVLEEAETGVCGCAATAGELMPSELYHQGGMRI